MNGVFVAGARQGDGADARGGRGRGGVDVAAGADVLVKLVVVEGVGVDAVVDVGAKGGCCGVRDDALRGAGVWVDFAVEFARSVVGT